MSGKVKKDKERKKYKIYNELDFDTDEMGQEQEIHLQSSFSNVEDNLEKKKIKEIKNLEKTIKIENKKKNTKKKSLSLFNKKIHELRFLEEENKNLFKRRVKRSKKEPKFEGRGKEILVSHYRLPNKLIRLKDGVFYGLNNSNYYVSNYNENNPSAVLNPKSNYGLFLYNSGCFYVGNWLNGYPHDYGYFYSPNGSFFYGKIQAGLAEGNGLFIRSQGYDFYYYGMFKNGVMEGAGHIIHKKTLYKVRMKNGKITYSEAEMFYEGRFQIPPLIKSGHDKLRFLAFVLNPLVKGEDKETVDWDKKVFGDVDFRGRKSGVCTILYKDGSRFHGMFLNDIALGFGLTADHNCNFELGLYNKTKLEVFGMICKAKGRRYIGCFEKGIFSGPGVVEYRDKWLFGYTNQGSLEGVIFKRKGKLTLSHFRIGNIINDLLTCGFGGYYHNDRGLKKPILRQENMLTPGKSDMEKEFFESNFLQKRFLSYINGNMTLEKSKSNTLLSDRRDITDPKYNLFFGKGRKNREKKSKSAEKALKKRRFTMFHLSNIPLENENSEDEDQEESSYKTKSQASDNGSKSNYSFSSRQKNYQNFSRNQFNSIEDETSEYYDSEIKVPAQYESEFDLNKAMNINVDLKRYENLNDIDTIFKRVEESDKNPRKRIKFPIYPLMSSPKQTSPERFSRTMMKSHSSVVLNSYHTRNSSKYKKSWNTRVDVGYREYYWKDDQFTKRGTKNRSKNILDQFVRKEPKRYTRKLERRMHYEEGVGVEAGEGNNITFRKENEMKSGVIQEESNNDTEEEKEFESNSEAVFRKFEKWAPPKSDSDESETSEPDHLNNFVKKFRLKE